MNLVRPLDDTSVPGYFPVAAVNREFAPVSGG